MKEFCRCAQRLFDRWLALGLIIGLIMVAWPGSAHAHGGTDLLTDHVEPYKIHVAASSPLQVGVNDILILVGRLSDGQIVLDAKVTVTAEPVDPPGRAQTFPATHANATNKLFYAASVNFPTSGRWKLTILVDGLEGAVTTGTEVEVKQQRWPYLKYLVPVGLSLGVIVLLFFVLAGAWGNRSNDGLEGGEG